MTKDDVISELNAQVASVEPNIGIRLGLELGYELARRNLLTSEKFGVLGTQFGLTEVLAYQKTHAVFPAWDIESWDFQVGGKPIFRSGGNTAI